MNSITSRQNPQFKIWSSLTEARGIKKHDRALVSGRKLCEEFLRQNPTAAEALLCPPKTSDEKLPAHVKAFALAAPLFKEIDPLGTKAPVLVVKTGALPLWNAEKPQGLELIVALSDPGNLGALLRSCEAFGVRRVILTEEACSPFLPKTTRAASGSNFRVAMAYCGRLAAISPASGFCLDMNGQEIHDFKWPRDLYLVLGEEGRGIPRSMGLNALSIPMLGHVESLNAMVAASIAIFSYRRTHRGGTPVA